MFLVMWRFRKRFNSNNWDGRCVVIIWIHLTNAVIRNEVGTVPKASSKQIQQDIQFSVFQYRIEIFVLSRGIVDAIVYSIIENC